MTLVALAWLACTSHPVSIAPAPPPTLADPERARFVAVGDTGRGNAGQAAVAAGMARVCAEAGCDFVLLLGDNLYERGMASDDDPRADALIGDPYTPIAPVYAVLGNHDWAGDDPLVAEREIAWAARRERFELPAHAWSFRAGPVFVAGVDTNAVFLWGGEPQERWLADALDASDAPWDVVLGHHPYRSNGPHGNAGTYEGLPAVPWASGRAVRSFVEGAICGRADLYLAGHDHSRQLLGACGMALVVSGAGGAVTEIVDRGNTPAFAEATLGFTWFELGPEGGVVRFHAADGAQQAEFPLAPRPR